jgi:hypothetical protein
MPISVLIVLVLRHNTRTRWIAELLAREGEQTAGPERPLERPWKEPTATVDEPQR